MKLTGETALVTGAGRGIGNAIARQLAGQGVKVAMNDVMGDFAEAACRELVEEGVEAIAVPGDVNDPQAVDAFVGKTRDAFGRIDILVNNAAAPAEFVLFESSTLDVQRDELTTLMGVIHCTRAVLPGMIENRCGRIVNISSVGSDHRQPGRAMYAAAKAGIEGFTRSLSAEVGQFGLTVNCVSPGPTESPRFKARSEELREKHRVMVSLGRFVEPEEVAQAVLFLAGDMADAVTGAVIDVDAGFGGFLPDHSRLRQGAE